MHTIDLDGDVHDDERGELLGATGSERAARPGEERQLAAARSWATDTVSTERAHVGDELDGRLDEALDDQAMTKRLRVAAIAHDVTIVLNHVLQRTYHVVSGSGECVTSLDEVSQRLLTSLAETHNYDLNTDARTEWV